MKIARITHSFSVTKKVVKAMSSKKRYPAFYRSLMEMDNLQMDKGISMCILRKNKP